MKINKLFIYATAMLTLVGCNDEWNEDKLDGFGNFEVTDIKKLEYTLTDADYKTIATNSTNKNIASVNEQSDALSALTNNKYFTNDLKAADYIPAFLSATYPTADNTSSIKVTYNQISDYPEYVSKLAAAENYEVSSKDYEIIWGEVNAKYFTPTQPISKHITSILSKAYPEASEGDVKVVKYKHSLIEPNTGEGNSVITELSESFNSIIEDDKKLKTELDGWLNIAETGDKYWVNNYYNGGYTECSAYGSDGDVIAWLISPKVDLSSSEAPKLAFDICLGYPKVGTELQVLVSSDFDGSDVTTATWTDLTTYFAFDASNAKYGKMSPAGCYDMSAFKETPIYLAFKYIGDKDRTTTFQLDNIQLGDNVDIVTDETYKADFEGDTELGGWTQQIVKGTYTWALKSYSGNKYVQFSANKSTEEQEAYIISPAIALPIAENGKTDALQFDVCIGYWNADCLSVLVSTDYVDDATNATWDDVTSEVLLPQIPVSGYGKSTLCGLISLKKYAGKDIRVAFKYVGNGAENRSTTYQIDNVKVIRMSHETTAKARALTSTMSSLSAIYQYDGSEWNSYKNAIAVSNSDYEEMGISSFSSSNLPANYLPQFLNKYYPYVQEGTAVVVVYNWGSTQEAVEYVLTNNMWTKQSNIVQVTDQFVKASNVWKYDPSVVIEIPEKSEASKIYFQAAVDYVWETYDVPNGCTNKGQGYVSSYGNNDYYSGASAYYGNVDWRASAAKAQYPAEYDAMSDEDIVAKMQERFIECMNAALTKIHPDAVPVDGVDVTYTINYVVYTGARVNWTIQYKVTAPGTFEYVAESMKPIE